MHVFNIFNEGELVSSAGMRRSMRIISSFCLCLHSEDNSNSACQALRLRLKEKAKSLANSLVQSSSSSSTKGIILIFSFSLLLLTALTYSQWPHALSFTKDGSKNGTRTVRNQKKPSGMLPTLIVLSCPTNSTATTTCHWAPDVLSSPSPSPVPSLAQSANNTHDDLPSSPSSCPNFFRYIYEDLKPWKSTGITKEMVERAKQYASFRLVIIGGKAYLEKYRGVFQTRDVFTIWGILQLLNRYPGRIPDLDLMFNCGDTPVIKVANYQTKAPPPLFRYCTDGTSVEIVFPDWSFWGWAELNIKPWDAFQKEIRNTSERLKWKDRSPYAFWKGNPWVAKTRQDLMRCNLSKGHDWNARLFAQDWRKEIKNDFKESNLAKQCSYRYKIYIEGRSWSVSEKYILACNSPTLLVTTPFIDFFSRGLMPGKHYWPINPNTKCKSIKFAVDWGNAHPKKAEDMGKRSSRFIEEELGMDNVYDYMLHLLTQYAKLLSYKPTIPEKATSICIESIACPATALLKKFMLQSMVTSVYQFEPCSLLPPFNKKELHEIATNKNNYLKQVEQMENMGKL